MNAEAGRNFDMATLFMSVPHHTSGTAVSFLLRDMIFIYIILVGSNAHELTCKSYLDQGQIVRVCVEASASRYSLSPFSCNHCSLPALKSFIQMSVRSFH